jgi:uncharacterized membrane protein
MTLKAHAFIVFLLAFFSAPSLVSAQEVHQDLKEIVRAEITDVITTQNIEIEGTDTSRLVQKVRAAIAEGTQEGRVVEFENEFVILEPGDVVYLHYLKTIQGDEYFLFKDYVRHTGLFLLCGLFVLLLLVFSGWHGLRALFSLCLSFGAIFFILVPLMLSGYDPMLTSLCVSAVILAVVLYTTHGLTAKTTIAYVGTMGAVCVTCIIAWIAVGGLKLTGFGSDAAVALNFATNGRLDFGGLLLGSIIIGILGMLDDVSVTQVSVVRQLKAANNNLGPYALYSRAIVVGKDHIGSLVNTLALAYVGVSLPLVLLFANADATLMLTLNQEVVAAELVRIVIGSIGLILAVPFSTLVAGFYFGTRQVNVDAHEHDHHHGHTH